MTDKSFESVLKERAAETDEMLKACIPAKEEEPETITEAMRYSLMAGGKRLRPILIRETYRMFGGRDTRMIEPFMAAMEMIHTYSLVHDDLPAMDNDEYRRGLKTTWVVYGEAMAILTGDALLNAAYETAFQALEVCGTQEEYRRVSRALSVLGHEAGIRGMIGGQVADIEAEGRTEPLTEAQIEYIHRNKTGALIKASMLIGAILAGASEGQQSDVADCALNIGMAFQIQDDILDVTGDSAELGKPVGSDAASGKQTYVTLHGPDRSRAEVERLSGEAIAILRRLPGDHDFLEELVRYLIDRRS
ncbi:MAG: polyprenyl synthetase family protein [Clostridium sp.]|nr:polyprenyl synthetase family protein [Acetatifactor muris]MCM1527016.1 polyprenyl synthetase family protein [Bacteroides sp.]MCM1561992.1 polyprenyl synthetase family protein [Clostridium sp.]